MRRAEQCGAAEGLTLVEAAGIRLRRKLYHVICAAARGTLRWCGNAWNGSSGRLFQLARFSRDSDFGADLV